MRGRVAACAIAGCLAVLAGRVRAEEPASGGTFGLHVQSFRPDVDSEFSGQGAYGRIFGAGRGWLFGIDGARTLWDRAGAIDAGLGVGFFRASGHGLLTDPTTGATTASSDATSLTIVPVSLFLAYRLDVIPRRTGWPVEPYLRLSLERDLWWTAAEGGASHRGATDGYGFTVGTAFLLDGLDPEGTRSLAHDAHIQHTALTVDVTRARVDDFGSRRSWRLSDPGWSIGAGLRFTF